jgi:hypothetical protein
VDAIVDAGTPEKLPTGPGGLVYFDTYFITRIASFELAGQMKGMVLEILTI